MTESGCLECQCQYLFSDITTNDLLCPNPACHHHQGQHRRQMIDSNSAAKRVRLNGIQGHRVSKSLLSNDGKFLCVEHCTLAGLEQCDMLFIRPEVSNLLHVLSETQFGQSIVIHGSPGTGKSTLTWFWMCALANNSIGQLCAKVPSLIDKFHNPLFVSCASQKLNVLWFHFSANHGGIICTTWRDGQVFRVGTYLEVPLSLQDFDSHADVVVFDGVTASSFEQCSAKGAIWLESQHLLSKSGVVFHVSSAQLLINSQVRSTFKLVRHSVAAWTLDEYLSAVENTNFLESVRANLLSPNSNYDDSAVELVRSKYFLAGACARWMFGFDFAQVQGDIDMYLGRCVDFSKLLSGTGGVNAVDAVNHLTAIFSVNQTFVVSEYVLRCAALRCDAGLIRSAAAAAKRAGNAMFDGWVVETDFLFQVQSASTSLVNPRHISLSFQNHCEKWKVAGCVQETCGKFLIDSDPAALDGTWLIPRLRNQGAFDAAMFELRDGQLLLRLINVTIASTHDLKLQFVRTLLDNLISHSNVYVQFLDFVFIHPSSVPAPRLGDVIGGRLLSEWSDWKPADVRFCSFERS